MAAGKMRELRARITRKIARKSFHFLERYFDLHVTANDYYSPIPSVKDLPEEIYERPFSMRGVDLAEGHQLALLDVQFSKYADEYQPEPNGGLSLVDAFVLYATIRDRKPRKMVEIGGGDSTLIAMRAVQKNRDEGYHCHFTCIEPYPRPFLSEMQWNDYQLMVEQVQNVPTSFFTDADIIFIDSSHVSKIGSDVNYEILEILPHTKIGCWIHWHDIVLPTNYWREWTAHSGQFWNESYMLHAFLLYNTSFSIRWAARYMKQRFPDRLKACFPYLKDEHRLTSFWVERIA
ncbi:MAG: class I SAM-dependent methyltransferase [Verrucomicrobiaceae bacterium]|nr:MAG: class I SAM-dependent methyltransferase [Verrucomicrobiaceae bacterium]